MPIEKEFGKLTHNQFRDLVRKLPEIRSQMKELPAYFRAEPDRLREMLGPKDYTWASIYEQPFLEQMAWLFIVIGIHEPIIQAARQEDPQEAINHLSDDDSELDRWYEANKETIDKKHLLWLTIVLQRNILSIMLFHRSMGALVDEVRRGNDESFFKAVRVDRTVLACPTFADRLTRAEIINDKEFFMHLHSAIKGLQQKHMVAIQDLRYSVVALRSMGFDRFTDEDLEKLFIRTRLYPGSAGALKAIRKHIHLARKIQPPEM